MPNVHCITGNDINRIHDEAKRLVRKLVGDDPDDFALEVYRQSDDRAPEETLGDAIGAILTPSFLGGTKTVWLQHFDRFDADAGKAGIKRREPLSILFGKLADCIADSFPDDVVLVLDGPGLPKRSALYKACAEHGSLQEYDKPDLKARGWQQRMGGILREEAETRGITLTRPIIDYLIEVVGVDTGRAGQELEKILCFAGERPTLGQVQEICVGNREAVYYALTNALGDRSLDGAFRAASRLLDNSKTPESAVIGLARQAAGFFRTLLDVKVLMFHWKVRPEGLEARVKRCTDQEKAQFEGNAIFDMNPYRAKMLAKQAANYSGPEIQAAIHSLAEADPRLVASGISRRLILENLIIAIVS